MREDWEALHRNRELLATIVTPPGWLVIRVDGRGFSALTEASYAKPFDESFHRTMLVTAKALMVDFGATLAYVQSDEISVALEADSDLFGRRAEKVSSVAAGIASSAFSLAASHRAVFDGRVIVEPGPWAVADYLLWRRSDAVRNALNSCLYWTLRNEGQSRRRAGRTLEGLSRDEKLGALADRGVDFYALDPWTREGSFLSWETCPHEGWNPLTQAAEWTERRKVAPVTLRRVIEILDNPIDFVG